MSKKREPNSPSCLVPSGQGAEHSREVTDYGARTTDRCYYNNYSVDKNGDDYHREQTHVKFIRNTYEGFNPPANFDNSGGNGGGRGRPK